MTNCKLVLLSRVQIDDGVIIKENTVENMEISDDGLLCLISPDETRWKLLVDDSGILSTEEVV